MMVLAHITPTKSENMTGNNKIECDLEVKQTKALEKIVASDLSKEDKPIEEILKYERKESNNTRTTQSN